MHEYSLVRALLGEVREVRRERRLGPIARVTIEIGEFSGVEPVLLESAFADLCVESLGQSAELIYRVIPLTAECSTCREEFHVTEFKFRCPLCRGSDVRVVRGEEIRLVSLDVAPSVPLPEMQP